MSEIVRKSVMETPKSYGQRVGYEVSVSMSKVSLARTMRALITFHAEMRSSIAFGDQMTRDQDRSVVFIMMIAPENVAAFRIAVKPWKLEYKSPTRFDNGTLIPLYRFPEEEIAAQEAEGKRRDAEALGYAE